MASSTKRPLAAALKSGHLGGAAMDVFDVEPIDKASGAVFAGVPNIILTPHVAGVTRESNARISTVTVENVMRVLKSDAHEHHTISRPTSKR